MQKACEKKIERDRKRGIKNRPVRAMIVGIPNVGKSTFINSFAGKACAKTGNKPGVTKGKQWIRLNKQVELLDLSLIHIYVKRYAKYLHKLTKNTQFIVITHRKGTMEAADVLYGITMQEKGVSTLVSVKLIEEQLDN